LTQSGSGGFPLSVVLSTVPERFFRERTQAQAMLDHKRYQDFFRTLDTISSYSAQGDLSLYYGSVQLYADGLFAALLDAEPLLQSEVIRIYRFEQDGSFGDLSKVDRSKLYLQYARAISKSPFQKKSVF